MAVYKVVDTEQLEADLTTVADSIRAKSGTTEDLAFPSGFKSVVESIDTSKEEQEKTISITENGTTEVTPDEGKVLSKVTVNVEVESGGGVETEGWFEDSSPVIYEKTCYQNQNIVLRITENGTAIYERKLRKGENSYYANQYPKWSYSNGNQLVTTHLINSELIPHIKQAAIVNPSDALDEELIKIVGNSCFNLMVQAKTILLPSSIEKVENYAFAYNPALKEIDLPNTIQSLGSNICRGCTSLKTFKIPESTVELGSYTFEGCCSLERIVGLERMTSIGSNCFDGCHSLQGNIVLNAAISTLATSTFRNCYGLDRIMFLGTPSGTINANCFQGCLGITDIYVPWEEDAVANAPWGATNATIHYNTTFDENGDPIV